jgi:hypothetical protein
MTTKLRRRTVVLLCAPLLIGVAVATAATADRVGMIDACYDKHGNLRLSLQGGACGKNETAISWPQAAVVEPPHVTGTVHFANVREDGVLESGDALSAQQVGAADYEVRFAQDLTACAATVSAGATNGGVTNSTAIGVVSVWPDVIAVHFGNANGNPTPTDFHLIVAC